MLKIIKDRNVGKNRSSCKDCKFKQKVIYPSGDFICIAKMKKPYRHTIDKKGKNNWIRECHQITGAGRRMQEMDIEELLNKTILSAKLLKKLGVLKFGKFVENLKKRIKYKGLEVV